MWNIMLLPPFLWGNYLFLSRSRPKQSLRLQRERRVPPWTHCWHMQEKRTWERGHGWNVSRILWFDIQKIIGPHIWLLILSNLYFPILTTGWLVELLLWKIFVNVKYLLVTWAPPSYIGDLQKSWMVVGNLRSIFIGTCMFSQEKRRVACCWFDWHFLYSPMTLGWLTKPMTLGESTSWWWRIQPEMVAKWLTRMFFWFRVVQSPTSWGFCHPQGDPNRMLRDWLDQRSSWLSWLAGSSSRSGLPKALSQYW